MTDTTSPIPSPTQPVIDRYRMWDPVWYRFLKPLFDTVRSTERAVTTVTSDLTTVTTDLDAVQASYGVTVNQNGRVTAAIKLDGSAAQSNFSILADKFIVVHPSVNGTTMQAFIVGNVNGTPTVGINGNLLVDGTIFARSINADVFTGQTFIGSMFRSADSTAYFDAANKRLRIGF